jgi:pyruvate/2-oxoglutarate dehydrogenase complex dihydrolipoamide acyltransferase (E2) component
LVPYVPYEECDLSDAYRKIKLPPSRLLAIDTMNLGVKGHYVKGFLEIDVTDARRLISEAGNSDTRVSFTGWLIKCLASAVREFPEVNAYRKGRRAYVFETVNIAMMVERELKGENVPLPYLVRDCDTKSVLDITGEIRSAKEGEVGDDLVIADRQSARVARLAVWLPGPLRRLGLRIFARNPVRKHKFMGTVGVTAVGMFGKSGGWPLPIPNVHPLAVAVGGIARKPRYAGQGDELRSRQMLDLTLMFDHDIIDGAPAARFSARLIELMESAHGLEEL